MKKLLIAISFVLLSSASFSQGPSIVVGGKTYALIAQSSIDSLRNENAALKAALQKQISDSAKNVAARLQTSFNTPLNAITALTAAAATKKNLTDSSTAIRVQVQALSNNINIWLAQLKQSLADSVASVLAQVKNQVSDSLSRLGTFQVVTGETFVAFDSTNKIFQLSKLPVQGSEIVVADKQVLSPLIDYTLDASGKLTFAVAPKRARVFYFAVQ